MERTGAITREENKSGNSISCMGQMPERKLLVGNDESSLKLWDESAAFKGKTGKENVALPGVSKKKPSFMDMITSAKSNQGDDEEENESTIKREMTTLSHIKVKLEAKKVDRRSSITRSKHSATEQRRRSKINDRFQKLREIIPSSEQKKDKASFLLEVIDYIKLLQERVNRFEGRYSLWSHESAMMTPLNQRNDHVAEGCLDHKRVLNADSTTKFDGRHFNDSDTTTSTTKERSVQRSSIFSFGETTSSDADMMVASHPCQIQQKRANSAGDTDDGRTSLSSIYSQGLLSRISEALQGSGVDLSQTRISVKIDLRNRANGSKETNVFSENDDLECTLKKQRRLAEERE